LLIHRKIMTKGLKKHNFRIFGSVAIKTAFRMRTPTLPILLTAFSVLSLNTLFAQENSRSLTTFTTDYGVTLNKDSMDQVMSNAKTIPVTPLMSCPSSNNLVTLYAQNNGQRGIMFDITAINCVQIKCFEANFDPGTTNVEIWTRPGTHVGFQNSSVGWTLIGTANNVVGAGANLPTAIPISVNITINAAATQAFYITRTTTGGPIMDYTNGVAVGNVYASDANIQVKEGTGKDYPFAASFSPRDFNGTIYYDAGGSIGLTGLITGPTSVCAGSTQTYSVGPVTNATTYSWTVPTGAVINSGQGTNTISVTFAGTSGTICVTPSNGCVSGTQVCTAITVNPLPVPSASASPTTICSGNSSTLNASGGTSYSWAPATGLSCSTCSSTSASPGSSTTYTVFVTNVNGCSANTTVSLTVNPTPTPTVTANPSTVCAGSTSALTATGGSTYSWSPATGLSSTTIANPNATPTATTTYTVVVTSGAGCSATSNVTVTVNPLPVASAGPDQSYCQNGSTTLNASGGVSYSWVPATNLGCSFCQSTTANPTSTTSYTVFVTGANGCTNSDTVVVTVNSLSLTAVAANPTICTGSSTNLVASAGTTWSWVPATGLSCTSCQTTTATPTATTTYTVFGTDANGCTASATVTVTVNTVPSPVATANPSAICMGSSSALNVTGGTTFSWTPATGLSSTTLSNPTATPSATTTYTVVATDPGGCTNSTTVTVTVNPVPTATASASPSTMCAGGSSQFTAGGGVSYSWSPATGLSNTTSSNPTAFPTVTTTYTVTVTDANGCTNSTALTLTINPLPNLVVTGNPTSICFGSSSGLNATGGNTYSWSPAAGLSSTTTSNPTAFPTATTTYTVVTVDANGCSATGTITLTILPLPTVTVAANPPTACQGGNTTLTASGANTYVWSPATGLSATTGASVNATISAATTYTVVGTSSNGCTSSTTITINLSPPPVLASGTSTPATCGSNDGTATAGGVTGNGPFTYSWSNGQTTATATGLAPGTYTVTVTDNGGCFATQTITVGSVVGVVASASANPSTGVVPLNVVFTNTSTGANNYGWNFGDNTQSSQQNPSHTYNSPGTYTVTLIAWNNVPGCADTITLTIIVYNEIAIVLPNVITPNGDGMNDMFKANTTGVTDITGNFYNRWGAKVGEWSGGVNGGWDGKGVSAGTYFYVLIATGADGKPYEQKGYVEILD
jgi:PKD repeat protein